MMGEFAVFRNSPLINDPDTQVVKPSTPTTRPALCYARYYISRTCSFTLLHSPYILLNFRSCNPTACSHHFPTVCFLILSTFYTFSSFSLKDFHAGLILSLPMTRFTTEFLRQLTPTPPGLSLALCLAILNA